MKTRCIASHALMLALLAGAAHAQPVVDGSLVGDNYGSVLWVQDQPTTFGDNVAGAGSAPGNPGDVVTGFEMTFPLSDLEYTGGPIKIGGFISGGSGDFLSNQLFGELPVTQGNLANPRGIDFNTFAGDQFLTINPATVLGLPTLDGTAEAAFWAGRRVWVNAVPTGFGDASTTNVGTSNGSELSNLYAVISQNGTPSDASDDLLCIFVGGNLESNGNKLALFFDTQVGGQNRILGTPPNPDWGNGFTRNIGDSIDTPNGLTWDAAFAPDSIAFFNTGGGRLFLDFVDLNAATAGYLGLTSPLAQTYAEPMDGGNALPGITIRFNNSNNAGLAGQGGPGGSVTPNIDIAAGSEINAVWGYVDPSTNLAHITITGNLENNYNKLTLFLDVNSSEGQNQLIGTNLDVSIDSRLNRLGNGGNGAVGAGSGLRFDTDFNADYAMFYNCGGSGPVSHFMDLATIRTNGPITNSGFVFDYVSFDGGDKPGNRVLDYPASYAQYQDFSRTKLETNGEPASITAWASTQPAPVPGPDYVPPASFANRVLAAFDNNNIAGVTATSATGGEAVNTGLELTIDLNSIGWDGTSPVKLAGFISSDNFAVTSNQVIGGSNSTTDLGEPSAIDFSVISGNQYVVIPVGVPGGGDLCNYDYNQDENVDLTDAQLMAQVAAGIISQDPSWLSGDLNGDENADLTDAQQLAQFVASGVCPI